MRITLVYAVYGEEAQARAAADMAVERHLAACANIMTACTSVYRWEGQVVRAGEIPVLFKTTAARRDALMAALAQTHGYEVPAILSWDTDKTHDPFALWVAGEVDGEV